MRTPTGISDGVYRRMLELPEENKIIQVPEIIVMRTNDGEIVCIPQEKDEPSVGVIGQRGSGKSYLLHRIADEVFS